MILSVDLNSKLKDLFSKKNYSKLEKEIEKLGKLEDLNPNLKFLYATAKALNEKSQKKDFKIAAYLYEQLYKVNQSNLELLYNLIFTSVKATYFGYLDPHINNQFLKNKNDPKILEGLGKMYSFYADMSKATKFYKLLLEIKPHYSSVWFSFLAGLNYCSDFDQEKYLSYCKEFDKTPNLKIENFKVEKKNKLKKIGFLSADLKTHSVSFFLEEIIENLKKDGFELHAISNLEISKYENVTDSLKKKFDYWHDTSTLDDAKFAENVRSLNLDILIDLCGYTFNNRANALRLRVANIQITWCGYCNTLGLKNIDFLIADPNLIKEDEKKLYSEQILFMPNIWNVMSKPKKLPEIVTHQKDIKIFTFGSFNNFQKISEETINAWSKILNNEKCRLILKNSNFLDEDKSNEIILKKFKDQRVNLEQINIIQTKKNIDEHLESYNKVDLALDTFPYPGVTTTFQSILMGVPVLTMSGFNFNSRCGESINKNLGLDEFIAKDVKDYINKASTLKKNILADSNYKNNLRKIALNSDLFNVAKFSKSFSDTLKSLI